MKLWVDSKNPAPNETEYTWVHSLDMATFAIILNEKKNCPYESINIGHIKGSFGEEGAFELLKWLNETGRKYPVQAHDGIEISNEYTQDSKTQFWVILWVGDGRPAKDLKPFDSFQEANTFCQWHEWVYVDKNGIRWNMDIEEREESLENTLINASERSNQTQSQTEPVKDYMKG